MPNETIYEELGVPHVVNATGTKTRIGGSRIRPEAVEAMARASAAFVRLSDLQARASELIADVTGADAGYVTCGASSALALGAAACIAGDDIGAMARLPETEGVPDEIVMPRTHRTGYDHALRAAGANIVDVGSNDRHLGTGSRNVEPWEIADAITENTAAVAYMEKSYTEPPLEVVCDIAHDNGVPVIVDAAAELPPVSNLSAFIEAGADLVAFSGGKAIRGPQTTGILAGRKDLVQSVAAQHLDMHAAEDVWEPAPELVNPNELGGVPRQGIGRPMKVGKEELVGLIRALQLFVEDDHDARVSEWLDRSERIAEQLDAVSGYETHLTADDKTAVAPEVVVSVDAELAGVTATDVVGGLRREEPRVFVGADALTDGEFTVNPMCLTDEEAEYAVERIVAQVEK
ncbi:MULTISPECIES: aminotransferase class V-fold PLP-dependent enzyme [unclassified Haladaptatus]|uniref:aminotransferase class V-fold PLP-dependent enzyme n=1 Tax=unclassified Haladaptatus TaxID=2622732 RepID=UPI00209C42C4|nr:MULTISPECIES: aminotransferase class V-fold PLP-dependent enzyme [unclassified Haladaptatus]MCO8246730.1 aminotransferase class V-fold PLP-dependent enzyme [Haladaptatus sp. AB643]MCO8256378.1 aminotransferase class V-fold PLP-dependent enzyme [Haladaptatus sp. AB618]